MYILGISCFYHDAAACLVKDGKVVAAAQEERFTRKKHDASFPFNAIQWCLHDAGITIEQVDHVGFYEKPLVKLERMLYQHVEMFPRGFWSFVQAMPSWINEKLRVQSIIRKKLKFTKDIFYLEHHMSHAAAAFLPSPFNEAAIVTVDGVGEWETTTLGKGMQNAIALEKVIDFPHSLGLLYSTVTAHLGFSVNNSEYKVMGLAPYGKPTYYDALQKVLDVREDGSYQLDMSFFVYHYGMRMSSKKFLETFGPIRKEGEELMQRHKDLAASLQKVVEEALFRLLRHAHALTKSENLCLAGGVALNSVANGKILQNTPFKNVWVQPAAGDAGSAMGAALYLYNTILGRKRGCVLEHAYLGPEFSDAEIRNFMGEHQIVYHDLGDEKALVETTARLIYEEKVVGWFQGRMEWGPRALGARSILSNPCNPKMQDILNGKVKHREKFRPFAPVVCAEDVGKYFSCDMPLPRPTDFMLMVYPFKKEMWKKVPAVVHVDGSGRLQTVRKEQHPLYWGVIKEFGKKSGIPMLINTSFNIRGEPIVCSPYDAYKCMMGTGIDCVVMGKFLVFREENMRDAWESEVYAKD